MYVLVIITLLGIYPSDVTTWIVRIFDIMTESEKTFMVVLPQENFQYSCKPEQIFYVTVRLFPPAPLHYPLSLVCSPHDVFFFF